MKNPSKILLFGALTLAIVGLAFAPRFVQTQATSRGSVLLQTADTPTPAAGADTGSAPNSGTQTASGVELWDQFCVKKIPYTLLALPKDASFDVVQPQGPLPTVIPGYSTSDMACTSVGMFRGKQVVVCRGPQLFSFSLKVSGASEDFQVPLKACPTPQSATP